MAKTASGSSTTSNRNYKLKITVTENSVNTSVNTSNITVTLQLESTTSYFQQYKCSGNISADGAAKASYNQYYSFPSLGSTITLSSWTGNIPHGDDGKKTVSVTGTVSGASGTYTCGTGTVTASLALTDIPRASKLTVPLSVEAGKSMTITATRSVSSYYHKAKISIGSYSYTTNAFASSVSCTVPQSWINAVPSAEGTAVCELTTYTNGNCTVSVGSVRANFKITVPSGIVPVISGVSADKYNTNSIVSSWGICLRGFSKARIKASVSAGTGASVKSCTVSCDGTIYNASVSSSGNIDVITNVLQARNTLNIGITVTDSRDRKTTASATLNITDYSPPVINGWKVFRCDESGKESRSGTAVSLYCQGGYSSLGGKNNLTVSANIAAANGSEGYSVPLQSGVTNIKTGLSKEKTYKITFTVSDSLGKKSETASSIASEAVAFTIFNGSEGYGAAMFDYADEAGVFKVKGDIKLTGGGTDYFTLKDFVTEYGTSGIWTYRKWRSGIAECWGRKAVNAAISTAWGNVYTSGALTALDVAYPFTFKELPALTANLSCSGVGAILMVPGSTPNASATSTGVFEICRGTAAANNATYTINYHAIGKWK